MRGVAVLLSLALASGVLIGAGGSAHAEDASAVSTQQTASAAPKVTTQPKDLAVDAGSEASFEAAATGSPVPTVQWQASTDEGKTWKDIEKADHRTLDIEDATVADSGTRYRAVFTNKAGEEKTKDVILTVTASIGQSDRQPSGQPSASPSPADDASSSTDSDAPGAHDSTGADTTAPAGTGHTRDSAGSDVATGADDATTDPPGSDPSKAPGAGSPKTSATTKAASAAAADDGGETHTGTSDPSVTFTAPTKLAQGEDLVISGTGWKTTDGSKGSAIAVKWDDGAINRTFDVTNPDGSVQANKQVFAVGAADADGNFTVRVPFPTAENSDVDPEGWGVGTTHSFRLLTGSIVPGDKIRTETASFTVEEAGTDQTNPGTSDKSVTFTGPTQVTQGDQIILSGTGWKTSDGSSGSVVAAKWDDGAVSANYDLTNPADGTPVTNKQVVGIAEADDDGNWTMKIPYPTTKNTDLKEDWGIGSTHSFRLLTGSLKSGDKVRTESAQFTIVAPGTGCRSGQILVSDTANKQTATACIQQQVTAGEGQTIDITGHGWLTKTGKAGSTVVLKLTSRATPKAEDFQFVHTGIGDDKILAHPVNGKQDSTIWAIAKADAKGDFATTVPVPQAANVPSDIGGAGALKAGQKLVVHFQSGLLDADTQHTVDSAPLVVDGQEYAGDEDPNLVACNAKSPTVEARVVAPGAPKGTAASGPIVSWGDTVHLVGSGWCNSDPAKGGSTIGVKIDDGAYSHRAGELVNSNPQVWVVVKVNSKDGSFDVPVTLPKKGNVAGGSSPAFKDGVHSFRLLTGSLKSGDPVRTLQTGPFTVGTYKPNGLPKLVEAKESLTKAHRHGVRVKLTKKAVKVTIPGAKKGDWIFLTAYLPDGSVRYPWAATWFRADAHGVVTAPRSGATLPAGRSKVAVQSDTDKLLGWGWLTVKATAKHHRKTTKNSTTTPTTTTSQPVTVNPTTPLPAPVAAPGVAAKPKPSTTPPPPFGASDGLTAANAHGVTGVQKGSVVTVTLPRSVDPGDWVFPYLYSTPTAVGWIQVDQARQIKLDLALMPAGLHKIAVLDSAGKLIGWTSATVDGSNQVAQQVPDDTGPANAAPPVLAAASSSGLSTANWWLIIVAVAVLIGALFSSLTIRSRRRIA